ncbi:MAG TPA: class I SAM-dependent methyltransferase [Pseudomonadales bacterium]|jgi:ubiquinone/menaquinone biosynthesis C-methylase UbiE|nr:class I SAM-dependent methyltransferase [Gammaproteobacteria bacterium]HIL85105.1 class I SAM-dependent methyltransferase [Pseudomonadales bacterium]
MQSEETILPFSLKYDATHCQAYFDKHRASASRRVSNYLEQRMANKALQLATNVSSCLDLPCGTGRFWDRLFLSGVQDLIAADYSYDMLNLAARVRPLEQLKKTKLLRTSAFAIDLPDQSVDLLFCMRLLHHIGMPEDRSTILKEFSRVARGEILVSLWVDGNLQASRRKKQEAKRASTSYQNRFIVPADQFEAEVTLGAGLEIVGHVDLLPGISMWRTYILRPVY